MPNTPTPSNVKTAMEKISGARARLILDNPFFGTLALGMRLIPTSEKTASTDGENFFFSPDFINGLTVPQAKGLIAHEVMHIALLHHTRRGSREHGRWNKACDLAINTLLLDQKFELPPGGLVDPAMRGKSADDIYRTLSDDPRGGGGGSGGQGQGPDEDGDGGGPWGEVQDPPSGSGQEDGSPPNPKPTKAPSQADIARAGAEAQVKVIQAAQAAKMAGRLPGFAEELVKQIRAPKVDWKEQLRRFIQAVVPTDYSWQRPNRRFVPHGLIMPSLIKEGCGEIILVKDTSGSVTSEMLEQFLGEINSVLEDVQPEKVWVLDCDTKVAHVEELLPGDAVDSKVHGRGGTDFRPPFVWADEQGIQPVCLIYLTDMECYSWPEPPDYPVLWASYGTPVWNDKAPFGEVLVIK